VPWFVIGVNKRGEKYFLAIEDGIRESTQSWQLVMVPWVYGRVPNRRLSQDSPKVILDAQNDNGVQLLVQIRPSEGQRFIA
jgi:hypothetical protein|tara:strand:- start:49 stop:291 length:243 start_codon:yes stop_codon:yes gene_type:complete